MYGGRTKGKRKISDEWRIAQRKKKHNPSVNGWLKTERRKNHCCDESKLIWRVCNRASKTKVQTKNESSGIRICRVLHRNRCYFVAWYERLKSIQNNNNRTRAKTKARSIESECMCVGSMSATHVSLPFSWMLVNVWMDINCYWYYGMCRRDMKWHSNVQRFTRTKDDAPANYLEYIRTMCWAMQCAVCTGESQQTHSQLSVPPRYQMACVLCFYFVRYPLLDLWTIGSSGNRTHESELPSMHRTEHSSN